MMKLINKLRSGQFDSLFDRLYTPAQTAAQKERYCNAVTAFGKLFGEQENLRLFSAPGRTEIGGNHTDHNHGRVLAGSVNLDVIAVVRCNDSNLVQIKSEGYEMDTVDINDLSVHPEEQNKAAALIRACLPASKRLVIKSVAFKPIPPPTY